MAESVPYIPPSRTLPEVTIKGVILGILLSVILGAANTYLGLRVGLTVSASIPAAVISMGVLAGISGLSRRVGKGKVSHNILENNAVQTAASAGESLAAGVLFTIPALLILNYWSEVGYWETTLVALAGGILGVLFTVPLRRALIVEAELLFPEGVATSEVLKAGELSDGARDTKEGHVYAQKMGTDATTAERRLERVRKSSGLAALVAGGLVGLGYKFLAGGMHLWNEGAAYARRFGDRSTAAFGADLSPALLGVGYIIGLRIASLVFIGGVLGWVVGMPIYSALEPDTVIDTGQDAALVASDYPVEAQVPQDDGSIHVDHTELDPLAAAGFLWSNRIRYIGVGAMLVGGVWALVKLRKALGSAVLGGMRANKKAVVAGLDEDGQPAKAAEPPIRTEQEFGARATFLGVLGMVLPITGLYIWATESVLIGLAMAVLMVVTGFLFSAVGAYMAGLVGSSNNPISGVTILTVLAAAITMRLMGVDSSLGPAATIFVAAIIACAGAIASDNMQDLKAGRILGSTPKRQQTMQIIGVSAAAFSVAPVLQLLHEAYTLGSVDMPAPQAGLMAAVGTFVFEGGLPMVMVATGAALAVLLIIIDEILAKRGSSFRTPVMPVAVGIYLPVGLSAPIFLGGLAAAMTNKWAQREIDDAVPAHKEWWGEVKEAGGRAGVLFASGLIAGEALIGIALAGIIVAGGAEALSLGGTAWQWPGLLMFGYLILLMLYIVRRPSFAAES